MHVINIQLPGFRIFLDQFLKLCMLVSCEAAIAECVEKWEEGMHDEDLSVQVQAGEVEVAPRC